jgi:hypothetical protein
LNYNFSLWDALLEILQNLPFREQHKKKAWNSFTF